MKSIIDRFCAQYWKPGDSGDDCWKVVCSCQVLDPDARGTAVGIRQVMRYQYLSIPGIVRPVPIYIGRYRILYLPLLKIVTVIANSVEVAIDLRLGFIANCFLSQNFFIFSCNLFSKYYIYIVLEVAQIFGTSKSFISTISQLLLTLYLFKTNN